MSKNLYSVLGVSRDAALGQIQSAFRALSVEFHPSKCKQADAADKFSAVSEAYQVLSDGKLRALYDQYGIDGLCSVSESKDGGGSAWRAPLSPEQQFTQFFGTASPFEATVQRMFQEAEGKAPVKAAPITQNVYCSLEELFRGCVKHVRFSRKRRSASGDMALEEKVFVLDIQPGWKAGTQLTFGAEGDEAPNTVPADLTFVLQERPHPRFRRKGNNLQYTAPLTLRQALTGAVIDIETLDGRVVPVAITEIVHPRFTQTVVGEGMPNPKQPALRGDLVIDFEIAFPTALSQTAKDKLTQVLPAK